MALWVSGGLRVGRRLDVRILSGKRTRCFPISTRRRFGGVPTDVEMLVLDNGNVRASPSGEIMEPEYSRAVTYILDVGSGQAMIDW